MLNRHATSKINIQNAIKTQGQAAMIIRKCNHKHQTRLIAKLCLLIQGRLVSRSRHIGSNTEGNVWKNALMSNFSLSISLLKQLIKTTRKQCGVLKLLFKLSSSACWDFFLDSLLCTGHSNLHPSYHKLCQEKKNDKVGFHTKIMDDEI